MPATDYTKPDRPAMDLLRFATAGSVDDGKSTLIGRLLLDSKSIFEDQLEAVEATSVSRGYDYTDLALLTDGLRSEREQGITIDVAYRYFATPSRKFIIADTPGHVQYTRNMVTGASTADLGLVLVDARQGLTEQSRRHAVILSLLRVPHLVLAVNKMDLVDYDQATFDRIHKEFSSFATKLSIPDLTVIPISALKGDNVVNRSEHMPWYAGLEPDAPPRERACGLRPRPGRHPLPGAVRRPPQVRRLPRLPRLRRPGRRRRAQAGRRGRRTPERHDQHDRGHRPVRPGDRRGVPADVVTVRLADDVDVSRGDMIARINNAPKPSQDIDAMVCWMTNEPLRPRQKLAIKHTTRTGRALVKDIQYRLDVNSLHRDQDTKELGLNEIGRDPAAHHRAAAVRPVLEEPHHRLLHPDRRGDRGDGRRRDDQLWRECQRP